MLGSTLETIIILFPSLFMVLVLVFKDLKKYNVKPSVKIVLLEFDFIVHFLIDFCFTWL